MELTNEAVAADLGPVTAPAMPSLRERIRLERLDATRGAALVFAGVVAIAVPVLLHAGRDRSFYVDEWMFLSARDARDLDGLFAAHFGHWVTLPVVLYRVLWALVGARTYVPYLSVLVAAHLTAAVLLRTVMRRAGVDPWIATAAATLFVFFGSGWQNIVWAFQITFVGALVFGLVHLVLADHDGPATRRDYLGMGAGLAGLTCSGVGVTMAAVAGLAVLLRRGWKLAALHTVPLAVAYGLWSVVWGESTGSAAKPLDVFRFARTGIQATFEAPGRGVPLALVFIAVLGAGGFLTLRSAPLSRLRHRYAAPIAMFVGGLSFWVTTGLTRGTRGQGAALTFGTRRALESRYVYIAFALMLPLFAIAATALARRWRLLLPAMVAVFLVGIPANLTALDDGARRDQWLITATNNSLFTAPLVPRADELPAAVRPSQYSLWFAPTVSLGWLRNAAADGKLPTPPAVAEGELARRTLDYSLERLATPTAAGKAPPLSFRCRTVSRPVDMTLAEGDVLVVRSGAVVARYASETGLSQPLRLPAGDRFASDEHPLWLRAAIGPLPITVTRADSGPRAEICHR
jgi:hypothetical protein